MKKAIKLITDFKLDINDFPEAKERVYKKAMRFYLGSHLYKKPGEKGYMTLAKVEDLLKGYKQVIIYLVEDLVHAKKINEALGIMKRNNVEEHVNEETKEALKNQHYNEATDKSINKHDAFEPLSKPKENFIQLPDTCKVEWIGKEEDVPKMEMLLNEELIGVDSEWRPQLSSFNHS